ncbi:TonB family protein [Ideonella livida]|uniref:TonB family protein n=1 Tax=Ideonella livida TaxID=2707176 RepID=A0A7C9PG68_9BURK|nr:TonB family protein [Ideonella livida]NDY91075.1 TonB family protein [Ideonella livida]
MNAPLCAVPRHWPRRFTRAALVASTLALVGTAAPHAQAQDTATTISERVKREAERPLIWIRLQAQKAEQRPDPKADPKPEGRAGAAKTAVTVPAPSGAPAGRSPLAGPASAAPLPTPLPVPAMPLPAAAALAAPAPNPQAAQTAQTAQAPLSAPQTEDSASASPVPASTPQAPAATIAAPADLPAPAAPVEAPPSPATGLALDPEADLSFPPSLMQQLRQGQVEVQLSVNERGRVTEALVLKASDARLRRHVLGRVMEWRFLPPARSVSAVLTLSFDLDA